MHNTMLNISNVSELNITDVFQTINSSNTENNINFTNAQNVTWGLAGANITANSSLTLSNAWLEGSTVNVTNGALNLQGSNVAVKNSNLTADGNITMAGNSASGAAITLSNNTLDSNNGNITLTGNSTNGSGVDISGGHNNFSAANGSIHIEGNRVQVKDSNITASNFSINATGTGFEVSNSTVNVTNNINLTATSSSSSSGAYLKQASLKTQNGSITITGNATSTNKAVHLDGNVRLDAAGNVTMNGTSNRGAGIYVEGSNNTLNASQAHIHGQSTSGNGFVLKNLNLTGNVANFSNVTLSSNGSGSSVTNRIDGGVLTTNAALKNVLNQSISSITLLNTSGISEYSGGINITDVAQLLNSSWVNASDGSLTLNLAVNGGAGWGFTNLNDITQHGDINISGLYLENINVTSNNGSITLTNGTVSLTNKSLQAANGNIAVDGKFVHLVNSSVTAKDISLTGNAGQQAGIFLNNASLNATQGNITINGSSSGAVSNAGITLAGNTTLNATNNIALNATNTNEAPNSVWAIPTGIMFMGGSHTEFTGNTTINANASKGPAITFQTSSAQSQISTLKFNNGTATINANSTAHGTNIGNYDSAYYNAISFDFWNNTYAHAVFELNNSNLSINANAQNEVGIGGTAIRPQSCMTIQGTGNLSINASGKKAGLNNIQVNNSNLSGTTTINGSSSNGIGVGLVNSTLSNTTITGNTTGNG
ncbi:hypothetical protein HEL88_024180, partial [Escherichia coli]|nr:hypothetical protein [Escherichia coli]